MVNRQISTHVVSSIRNVEPPSTEPSTAKFFKILEYTQLTVRQISSGSSQNWSIGTGSTHVPRASIQNQRARASTKRKKTIKWIRIHCWWSLYKRHDRELALQLSPWTALASVESTRKKLAKWISEEQQQNNNTSKILINFIHLRKKNHILVSINYGTSNVNDARFICDWWTLSNCIFDKWKKWSCGVWKKI